VEGDAQLKGQFHSNSVSWVVRFPWAVLLCEPIADTREMTEAGR